MDPLVMGLITGGSSLLGSIFSSSTSASNTQAQIAAQQQMQGQAEQFNASQSEIQRDYETQMSNSAYQRASADMTKAGLNPAMMFGSGGASSTPSVGAASVGTPNVPMPQKTSPLAGLGQAVGSGIQSAVTAKTMDKLTGEIANLASENDLIKARTQLTGNLSGKAAQDVITGLPEETKAQLFNDWLRKHPDFTTGSEVAGYGAKTVGSATSAIGNVVGLGSRIGSAIEDVGQGFSSTAKRKFEQSYTLPAARQRMKDLESSFQGGE